MFRRLVPRSISTSPQPGLIAVAEPRGLHLLLQFTYLQLLDALTTLVFLTSGVREANPLVRFAMKAVHSPLGGLLLFKLAAFSAAVYCLTSGRKRVLSRMNLFFALLVIWNLIALLAA